MTVHSLPINDIRHAWVETRRSLREIRPNVHEIGEPYDVFVGVCTCGWRTEGVDSSYVTHAWLDHVHEEE